MRISKENFKVDINDQTQDVPNEKGARQSKLLPPGEILEYVFEDAKTVVEAIRRGHKVSNDGPCLGWRDSDPEYKWMKYSEVLERSQNIAYGLIQIGMKPGQDTFVGIYAQNSVEWVLFEHACYLQSAIPVALYDTLGPTASTFILNQVEAEYLMCDSETKVKTILDVKDNIPKLRHIIVVKEVGNELQNLAKQKQISLHLLRDVEEMGKQNHTSLLMPKSSDLATICFTSGTTGNPKGVMLTHSNIVADACGLIKHYGVDVANPGDIYMSYLPSAHMFDRISQVIMYLIGASVGFFRGDITLLAEDIKALKPTLMPVVPRILNKIYDKVHNEVKSSVIKKFMLKTALRAKKSEIERGIIRNDSIWDHLVFKKLQNILGGRVRWLLSGGALVRHEVLSFFQCSMGCPVSVAYGQTEATAATTCTALGDITEGTVGPPLPCNFVKLADVPDMGYFANKGEGEILIKGPTVTKGYYKDPVGTAEILDDDGWLHTGDIGKWLSNGSLSIIDRKKSLLKLSQGEYISPEKIEAVYMACQLIEQIFVHGNSLESCLVAIVVPEKDALMSWCSQKGISGEWKDICENQVVKRHILEEMSSLGRENGLKGFEMVKAIHLNPESFSFENGILTVTMKLKRTQCHQIFRDVIQKMYEDLRKGTNVNIQKNRI